MEKVFLTANAAVLASYPQSPLAQFAASHNAEFIVAGCLVMGVAGTIGGMLYPMPDGSRLRDWRLKLVASFMGGVAAFVYAVDSVESLRPITILWCGGVALVAPALLDQAHALLISLIKQRFGGA